jgi:hypothetical protein
VTDDAPTADAETGLPGKQGEFGITLPWIARFALTAAIGAVVGFAASHVLPARVTVQWGSAIIVAGAMAATLLSIRKVHGWHVSTFADGTIAAIAAAPILVVVKFLPNVSTGNAGQFLIALLMSLAALPITVPCGWVAGFFYHLVLSAAERARSRQDEDAQPS